MNYQEQYDAYLARAKRALEDACRRYLPAESQVCQAARYSLMGGGKRVRAVLVLSVCDMLGGDDAAAEQFAAAVEMLHCYSLIHDDLPCMDDDDLRRGRPSCHKAFGEATAGAGSRGMVYGQELDLKYEVLDTTESQLLQIHRNKTGALINAAVQMGAAAAGANAAQREALEQYAFGLGLVFQIIDDILDATATTEQLGKPAGSDQANGKTTFVTLYGADGAMTLAQQVNQDTCEAVHTAFGEKAAFLEQLAAAMLERRS